MKRAMFIKKVDLGAGDALLYKLSDPVKFGDDEETFNVVVSAVTSPLGGVNAKRATVFASDEKGNILSWKDIAEKQNTLDHEEPLVELGYEIM